MNVSEFLLDTLGMMGVSRMFGNPGTTEIPLVEACEMRQLPRYVVVPSEIAAVAMADGYARASRSLGVVNLHVAPGLGNGMGALYTANLTRTPLLVVIGAQDRRHAHADPTLHGPVLEMARTLTKAVYALTSRYDAEFYIRKAIRTALTPPYGPVAITCPLDLMSEQIEEEPTLITAPRLSGLDALDAQKYAHELMGVQRPALVVTDEVYWSAAEVELESLAVCLGAPIYIAPYTGMVPVDTRSAQYAGFLPPNRGTIVKQLSAHDLVFFVGGRGLRTTLYSTGTLEQPKLWLGSNPDLLAAEGEYTLARVADIGASRRAIRETIDAAPCPARSPHERKELDVPALEKGIHPSRAVQELLRALPDALLVDESGISNTDVRAFMRVGAGEYLSNGSGGLGWGVPAAVGIQLARSDRRVLGIMGDGSMLYSAEAMWTAVHERAGLVLAVLVNRRYATLDSALQQMSDRATLRMFSLEPPTLRFEGLAHMYGWRHCRASSEPELGEALRQLREATAAENTLIEILVDASYKPVTVAEHF